MSDRVICTSPVLQASLDVFRKLLLIRSSSPDRTLSQARKYIHASLGADFLENLVLDLEAMLEESDNKVAPASSFLSPLSPRSLLSASYPPARTPQGR